MSLSHLKYYYLISSQFPWVPDCLKTMANGWLFESVPRRPVYCNGLKCLVCVVSPLMVPAYCFFPPELFVEETKSSVPWSVCDQLHTGGVL